MVSLATPSPAFEATAPDLQLSPGSLIRWNGLPVFHRSANLETLAGEIPEFERKPFAVGSSLINPFVEVVVRKGVGANAPVPVALVSPAYRLVQHREIIDRTAEVLEATIGNAGRLKCEATFTTHSEKMELRVHFPRSYIIDVGDRHPVGLQLIISNSVDGGACFGMHLGWFRFICSNGLIVGTTAAKCKKVHRESLNLSAITDVLREGLTVAEKERKAFQQSLKREIPTATLGKWIDGPLASLWGVKKAARVLHITMTGHDCDIIPSFQKERATEQRAKATVAVPGALPTPVTHYAVAQALSWIASHRNAMQERLEMTRQIPGLLAKLKRR